METMMGLTDFEWGWISIDRIRLDKIDGKEGVDLLAGNGAKRVDVPLLWSPFLHFGYNFPSFLHCFDPLFRSCSRIPCPAVRFVPAYSSRRTEPDNSNS
jgi:hypothetical protein